MITISKENKTLYNSLKLAAKILKPSGHRHYFKFLYSNGLPDSTLYAVNGIVCAQISTVQNIPKGYYSIISDKTRIRLSPETEYADYAYPDIEQFFKPEGEALFISCTVSKTNKPQTFCNILNTFYGNTGKPIAFDYNYMDLIQEDLEYNVFTESNNSPIQFISEYYSLVIMPFHP